MPDPEFNPDENELRFDMDKAPQEMSAPEREAAAQHGLYEAYRQIFMLKATLDFLAELCGVQAPQLRAIEEQAEADEIREGGEADYEVADSYEDAAAGRTRPAGR